MVVAVIVVVVFLGESRKDSSLPSTLGAGVFYSGPKRIIDKSTQIKFFQTEYPGFRQN